MLQLSAHFIPQNKFDRPGICFDQFIQNSNECNGLAGQNLKLQFRPVAGPFDVFAGDIRIVVIFYFVISSRRFRMQLDSRNEMMELLPNNTVLYDHMGHLALLATSLAAGRKNSLIWRK